MKSMVTPQSSTSSRHNVIQKNGLPRKTATGFSRSQTNLSQAGLSTCESFQVDIASIKSSLRTSEAPVSRYSDLFFLPTPNGGGAGESSRPSNIVPQSNRPFVGQSMAQSSPAAPGLSNHGNHPRPSPSLNAASHFFQGTARGNSTSSRDKMVISAGYPTQRNAAYPGTESGTGFTPSHDVRANWRLPSSSHLRQHDHSGQACGDCLGGRTDMSVSTASLMGSPDKLASVAAVQAALPLIESQNVRSQLVSKPILQHASAPQAPRRPIKREPPSSSTLGLDSLNGTFQQYGPVGPLATGRCERVILGDTQFKDNHQRMQQQQQQQQQQYRPFASKCTATGVGTLGDRFEGAPSAGQDTNDVCSVGSRASACRRTGAPEEGCAPSSSPVTVVSSPLGDQVSACRNDEGDYVPQDRHRSPVACRFYMEQRIENIEKYRSERQRRRVQLETEMQREKLDMETRAIMRQMLIQRESMYLRQKRAQGTSKVGAKDFEKVCTVGEGAFGQVILARKKESGYYYAIKILIKSDIMERNQFAHVKAERDILAEAENEWVVKLFYSFQDDRNLYFVMEYVPGGDLMKVLENKGFFDEPLARFYTAELVCAIGSVHTMGFIHRDIKPDNILIDRRGHIKLTDFGLCTGFRWTHKSENYNVDQEDTSDMIHVRTDSLAFGNRDKVMAAKRESGVKKNFGVMSIRAKKYSQQRQFAHSQVGTPNYMAPEVIGSSNESGYTQVCDWWSLGVILYEMLCGRPPFFASSPEETQKKVLDWRTHLHLSSHPLSSEAADLITRLCCEPEKRLGNGKSQFSPKNDKRPVTIVGAEEIKNHPFFRSIDWTQNLRQQTAPYIPLTHGADDTSNFDRFEEEKSLFPTTEDITASSSTNGLLHRVSSNQGLAQKNHQFYEFTFRRFFDIGGDVDSEVLKTAPLQTSSGSYDLPGACGAPVNHRQSQCLLEEQDSWISSQVNSVLPSSRSSVLPSSSFLEHRLHDPPPYSAVLATESSVQTRDLDSQQLHDNVPVYV